MTNASESQTLATELDLEADIQRKLCGIVGEDMVLGVLVAQWKALRAHFTENEAARVEAAIRRRWRRS